MNDFKPRRSVLYMPGANQRALEKAKTLACDSIIFDLEDAVSPDQKVMARQQVIEAIKQGGYGDREVTVRINVLSSEWGTDDLSAVLDIALDTEISAIVLPKVENAGEVQSVAEQIIEKSPNKSVMDIWAMIETPLGVQNVKTIAESDPHLKVLVMGTSDLAKELRIPHSPDRLGFLYSLSRCVLAARAAHLDIIDGVQLDLEDESALHVACEQGRYLGFDGKSLIHPKQIPVANQVFSPSEEQVSQAQEIITAWSEASQQGSGVAVLNGKLVENLHAEEAKRILAVAEVIKKI